MKKAKQKELNKLIGDPNIDLVCGERNATQDCKKYLAKDWGMVQFIIPRQNCSTVEFESLSRFWFLKSLVYFILHFIFQSMALIVLDYNDR